MAERIIKPTRERLQHGRVVMRQTAERTAVGLDEDAHPLDWLERIGAITPDQLDAGIAYHKAYMAAGRSRSGVSKYGAVFGGGSDKGARAGRWCRDSEREVIRQASPDACKMVMLVAGEAQAPEANYQRWIISLRNGLDVLADMR